ncbi:hypothetical protein [Roseateles flavus]|uniref:hypothetical protein n=1 Tax=Roseateles flavus TaxID=3149041 RepID=UPI003D34916C
MDHLKAQRLDDLRREVPQLGGDDAVGVAGQGGAQRMDVIRIREAEPASPGPPCRLRHLPVRHGGTHLVSPDLEPAGKRRSLHFQRCDPLAFDLRGPLGGEEAGGGQAHQ